MGLTFLAGAFCGLIWTLAVGRLTQNRELQLLEGVVELTQEEFVGDVDPAELVDDALRGMLSDLDDYSAYYGPEEIARLDRETYGEFRGIGVVFLPPTAEGRILFPVPGGPAARAGIRVGDKIQTVDGLTMEELPDGGLAAHIQAVGAAPLNFRMLGLDGEERELEVVPEPVLDPTVRHARLLDEEKGIGYLAILSFTRRTPDEFDRTVRELEKVGMKSLVIDLRSNPGGILDAAVELANRFVSSGVLVSTETRAGTDPVQADPNKAELEGLPLVLLVDGRSASASEVLAGAMQDHASGVLVGRPTYGKGTVQTLTRFGQDRAIVKLTTGIYLTPSGKRIERVEGRELGITPDVSVALEDEERVAVYRFLNSYSPPRETIPALLDWEESSGREILPTPPEDRQLEIAVKLLLGETPDEDALQ